MQAKCLVDHILLIVTAYSFEAHIAVAFEAHIAAALNHTYCLNRENKKTKH